MLDVIINLSPIYKLEDLLKNTLRHHPASRDHDLNNLELTFPLGYCNTNFSFSGKTVLKEFSIYISMLKFNTSLWLPTYLQMICTKVYLLYLSMLQHKLHLFCSIGFLEGNFLDFYLYIPT